MDRKELLASLKAAKQNMEAYKAKRLAASSGSAPSNGFAAEEKSIASKWGVKSLNELIKVNTGDKKFSYMTREQKEAVKSLKEASDITLMVAKVFGQAPEKTKAYDELVRPAIKALGITSGDVGYAWIPTVVSDSYIDEYNLERKVAALFQEVKMPSNPFVMPVLSNGAIATKLSQNSQKSSKDQFASSSITLTATKLSNQYELPEELQEDSAVDVMKVIRQELIEGQEKAMEIAILEGDTAATHQHSNTGIPGMSGAPATDSPERVFDGLRKRALAASAAKVDAGAAAVNEGHMSSARKAMGKFGVNPAELAIICGPKGYNELQQLDDVRTLEQYGPQAPVLSGELAKYEGIPVIVSEWLREDTAAAGVNSTSGNTKLTILVVNRKRFFTGLRRAVQIKVENNRTAFDVWDMVSFSRRAFEGILKADGSNYASESTVAIIYNIA
jgi:HK97 family phage major capsid protein